MSVSVHGRSLRLGGVARCVALLAVACLPDWAAAQATAANFAFYTTTSGSRNSATPGSAVSNSSNDYGSETSFASATAGLVASVNGSTENGPSYSSAPGAALGAGATATVNYFFEILGPSNVDVPVIITGSASTAVDGGYGSYASASINWFYAASPAGGNGGFTACSDQGAMIRCKAGQPASSSFEATFSVLSNLGDGLDGVSISATGVASGVAVGPTSMSAMADPTLAIDPTWLVANPGYSLVLSSNITQPVPEPGTAWSMFAGMVTLAGIRRAARRIKS